MRESLITLSMEGWGHLQIRSLSHWDILELQLWFVEIAPTRMWYRVGNTVSRHFLPCRVSLKHSARSAGDMVLLATTRQRFRARLDGMQGDLHRFNDRPHKSEGSGENTR